MNNKQVTVFCGYAAVILLGLFTLFQGGFYSDVACSFGLVSLVLCIATAFIVIKNCSKVTFPLLPLLLVSIGVCVYVSAALSGATLDSIGEAGVWFAVALFSLLCEFIQPGERSRVYRVLGWVGVATAILSLLMCGDVVPYGGSLVAGRLQYSFQYANTAALWFAIMFFVAALSEDKNLRICAFFPFLSLMLAQSVGTLVLFFVGFMMLVVLLYKREQFGRIGALFLQLVCVCVGAGVSYAVGLSQLPWMAAVSGIVGFTLLILLRRYFGSLIERFMVAHVRVSLLSMVGIVFIVGIGLVAVFVATGRFEQASQTFIERLVQASDAFVLLGASPFIGIGPEGWAASYQSIQSAQYVAQTIHNGYLNIALMAGGIGLLLFLILVSIGAFAAGKNRDDVALFAILLIVVHAFFDFDLAFASMLALLVFFLPEPAFRNLGSRSCIAGFLTVLIVAGLGCTAGSWAWQQKNEAVALFEQGNIEEAEALLESDILMRETSSVQTAHLVALSATRQAEKVKETYFSLTHPNLEQVMLATSALQASGSKEAAEDILLSKLEEQPRNTQLLQYAERFFTECGLSESGALRYGAVLDEVNMPYEGIASLLHNQKTF